MVPKFLRQRLGWSEVCGGKGTWRAEGGYLQMNAELGACEAWLC